MTRADKLRRIKTCLEDYRARLNELLKLDVLSGVIADGLKDAAIDAECDVDTLIAEATYCYRGTRLDRAA